MKDEIKELFRLADFKDNIYSSQEYKRILEFRLFRTTFEVFAGNHKELQKILHRHEQIDLYELVHSKNGSKKLRKIQLEITRCLHNFLASALTLIDNTRKNISHCDDTFKLEYQEKVGKLINDNPIIFFIKDLRRFTQHYKMPQVSTRTIFTRLPPDQLEKETRILITTTHLIGFEWSAASKKLIEQNPKGIEIKNILNEYYKLISEFQEWYEHKQKSILNNDIKFIRKQEIELNRQEAIFNISRLIDRKETKWEEFNKILFRHVSTYFVNKIINCSKEERFHHIIKSLKQIKALNPDIIGYIKKVSTYWP